MSVKDLFDHGTSIVSLKSGSLKDAFSPVESDRNIQQIIEKQNRFIPPIDFSTTSNFAKFGSAELYYDTAIKRIYGNYPYDGTAAEKNKFDNQSLYIDKYIFDYLYPKSTGYAIFSADGWGSRTAISTDGYATPSTLEYIQFRGGPHTSSYGMDGMRTSFSSSNVYDENIYDNVGLPADFAKGTRTSNLRFTASDGATVEFWMKKPSFDTTNNTHREIIFDLWNNQTASSHSGSTCYGRMMIELDGQYSTGSSFLITLMSGTTGFQHRRVGSLAGTSSLSTWNHYAFTFLQSGSFLKTKFYVNGSINEEVNSEFIFGGFEHGQLKARIGALLTAPTGSAAPAGAGKFSGSLDEFRYWKAARSSKQISDFYFVPVNGGTNTDIANATLGVYYKFNEGITGTSSTDSTVLDYSGRVTNGAWIGYGANSRDTGSAIVESSASNSEALDPIIHPNHTEVQVLHDNLMQSGTLHDHLNNAMVYNTIPSWITDDADNEGSEDLKYLSHILGVYFDKLYLQIESLAAFNNTQYLSASYKAFPFYKNAIEGKGLETPELFVEADLLEKFAQRTDTYNLNLDLVEIKNLIYQNIHSNLVNIYKAKGTEKAIRNIMRTFGIGDDLVKLNLYANNATYELKDNLQHQSIKKKYLNFSKKGNDNAVVYQTTEAGNTDSFEFISGSKGDIHERTLGFTLEANVMFPKYFHEETDDFYDRNWLTSSLFGMFKADHTASSDVTTFAPSGSDYSNFQVQFIRDFPRSRSGHFRISSSNSPYPIPEMTSSKFLEVYDDDNWLVSFTLQPKRYRELSVVSGASHLDVDGYDAIFAGYHKVMGTTVDSFYLTQSMETTASRDFLMSDKRIFAGAHRDNITGTLLYRNDTKLTEMRYWAYSLEPEEIERHAVDIDNIGILNPYRIIGNLDPNFRNMEVRRNDTLALHWNFNSVTTSDAAGEFIVQDASSGSTNKRTRLGIFGNYSGYQHTGKGKYFGTSSKEVISYEFLNNAKFRHYEQIVSSDMINILGTDDHIFGSNQRPTNYHFTIEKSMYDVISQEILNVFAGIVDFNNLIGEPVNRYRDEYKDLGKLRTIFFDKVGSAPDINRYLDFYKWFDDALSLIVRQLVPATADISDDLYNVIEEHALERNKYKTPFPTMEFKEIIPEAFIRGIEELEYSWKFGHSPLPGSKRPQHQKGLYWKSRAEKGNFSFSELTIRSASLGPYTTTAAGAAYVNSFAIDIGREEIRDIIHANPHFSQSLPILTKLDGTTYEGNAHAIRTFAKTYKFRVSNPVQSTFKGGVNFSPGKSMERTYNAVAPGGPLEAHGSIGGVGCEGCKLPVNILFARSEDFEPYRDLYDPLPPHAKIKKKMKVTHGRDSNRKMLSYASGKSGFFFPMNIVSGTIDPDMLINSRPTSDSASHLVTANNAYERQISGNITNIHNDVYGRDMEKPMQGPFTEHVVGGHQSRHVAINTGVEVTPSTPATSKDAIGTQENRPEAWRIYIGRCGDGIHTDAGTTAVGIVGPDYPKPDLKLPLTANLQVSDIYPYTPFPRAAYYRDGTTKRPVNIGNIHHTTGSPTILGNFNNRYDFLQTAGRESQRRYLKDTVESDYGAKPAGSTESVYYHTASILPTRLLRDSPKSGYHSSENTSSAHNFSVTNVHTLISVGTGSQGAIGVHGGFGNIFGGMPQSRLGGARITSNRHKIETGDVDGTIFHVPNRRTRKGVFTSRFSAPGGPEVLSPGYLDIHTGEFSVYNSLVHRNLMVRSSGSGETRDASVTLSDNVADKAPGYKSIRMHNHMQTGSEDQRLEVRQGLRTLLTRHAGKNYSEAQYGYVPETLYIDEDDKAPASFHKVHQNKKRQLILRDADIDYSTKPATVAHHGLSSGEGFVITGSNFDNYWIQRTIPRSDVNYRWITGSILHDGAGADKFTPSTEGHFGYLPFFPTFDPFTAYMYSGILSASKFYVDSPVPKPGKMHAEGPWGRASAYKQPYNFLSASEYVVYVETGSATPLRLGIDKNTFTGQTLNHLPVDFVGLNNVVVESITSSTAQLGFHIDHNTSSDGRPTIGALGVSALPQNPPYINDLLVNVSIYSPGGSFGLIPFLNLLTLHRQGPYGWPSWKQTRGGSHPIMRFERERNILREPTRVVSSSLFGGGVQKRYHIQPVTSKYKPIQADIGLGGVTLPDYDTIFPGTPFMRFYATNYNQIVMMQSDERDGAFFSYPDATNTFWDSFASVLGEEAAMTPGALPGDPTAGEFPIKVIYSETVWPSSLMTYMSSSRGRKTYSEKRWAGIHSDTNADIDRITLGQSLSNSKGSVKEVVDARRFIYTSGSRLTQSSWPLDAHADFLTRVGGPGSTGTSGTYDHYGKGPGCVGGPPRVLHMYHRTAVSGAGNYLQFGGTRGGSYDGVSGAFNATTASLDHGYDDTGGIPMNGFGFITGGYHNGEGELQNGYTMFHGNISILSGAVPSGSNAQLGHVAATLSGDAGQSSVFPFLLQINPTALYARKQTLSSYRSVVSAYGVDVPETSSQRKNIAGAFTSSLPYFTGASLTIPPGGGYGGDWQTFVQGGGAGGVGAVGRTAFGNIDLFGGEAAWQAPELAGYISTSLEYAPTAPGAPEIITGLTNFWVSASSEPWYEKYEDYILDPRAVAKEYSIVPEYSSKRWVPESFDFPAWPFFSIVAGGKPFYHYIEINNGGVTGSFNAAEDKNPQDVVFKVMRGDNLRDLLGVQENLNESSLGTSRMGIARLKLKMDALIKFIPYEGFYPAQRTLQLAEEFWKSHGSEVRTSFTPIDGLPVAPDFPGVVSEPFIIGGQKGFDSIPGGSINSAGQNRVYHDIFSSSQDAAGTAYGKMYKSYPETSPAWAAHYTPGLMGVTSGSTGWTSFTGSDSLLTGRSFARPLAQTLFAPGILYNTIKSGLAVDYPICISESFERVCIGINYTPADELDPTDYWVLSGSRKDPTDPTFGRFDYRVPFEALINPTFIGGAFDGRPIVDMEPHPSAALQYTQTELVPAGSGDRSMYSQKTSNFFAGVADFFLDNKEYTTRQSELIPSVPVTSGSVYGMRLRLYRSMAKARDYSGNPLPNNQSNPFGSDPAVSNIHHHNPIGWAPGGVTSSITKGVYPIPQDPHASGTFPGYTHWDKSTNEEGGWPGQQGQKETFTMYSRPTAFGPPIAGRHLHPTVHHDLNPNQRTLGGFDFNFQHPFMAEGSGTMDSINGYNWAFTPGYYHGQAWVDIVYKPSESAGVTLEQIFNSPRTYINYRRVDPGPTGSFEIDKAAPSGTPVYAHTHRIIPDPMMVSQSLDHSGMFYAGRNINFNAMQMSASFNIFNLERENQGEWHVNSAGDLIPRPTAYMGAGRSWVIQSKFETPMLNFNDQYNIRALHTPKNNDESEAESGYIDVPIYASESVPRGMWHQFGTLPTSPEQGIFLDVGDIPQNWLKNHYDVIQHEPTIYNNHYNADRRALYHLEFESLADLIRMPKGATRLGEMPEEKTVSEAVVAIPYYIEDDGTKRFFQLQISKQQINEFRIKRAYAKDQALSEILFTVPGPHGRNITSSGLLYLFDKMERFVFPPKLDFIRYPEKVLGPAEGPTATDPGADWDTIAGNLGPLVMYVFEFEHTFDKADLSYMWQNLAPRDYKSYKMMSKEISHDLLVSDAPFMGGNEFLSRDDFYTYQKKMRWMVFKVKQRGVQSYADVLRGYRHWRDGESAYGGWASSEAVFGPTTADGDYGFPVLPPNFNDPTDLLPDLANVVEHNWPYDYFSLVESAKLTIDVEFRPIEGGFGYVTVPPPPMPTEMWSPAIVYSYTEAPPEVVTTGPDVPDVPEIEAGGATTGIITATSIELIDPDDYDFG